MTFNGFLLDFVEDQLDTRIGQIAYNQSTADATFVAVSGDDMTGDLNMTGNSIESVDNITLSNDPPNLYIDSNATCVHIKGPTSNLWVC